MLLWFLSVRSYTRLPDSLQWVRRSQQHQLLKSINWDRSILAKIMWVFDVSFYVYCLFVFVIFMVVIVKHCQCVVYKYDHLTLLFYSICQQIHLDTVSHWDRFICAGEISLILPHITSQWRLGDGVTLPVCLSICLITFCLLYLRLTVLHYWQVLTCNRFKNWKRKATAKR